MLGDKEQNMWQEVSVRNEEEKEGRKEENVEGLVHKSKGFFPMNLSNPKGESFDVEGRCCVGEGRLEFVQLGLGFGSFFQLIIHIQRDKMHFGPYDKDEESKRKEALLTYKKTFSYKHGSWAIWYVGGNC